MRCAKAADMEFPKGTLAALKPKPKKSPAFCWVGRHYLLLKFQMWKISSTTRLVFEHSLTGFHADTVVFFFGVNEL
jgi:hypothetical protein